MIHWTKVNFIGFTKDVTHRFTYLSTFENFPGVESARQLVSDILPIVRGRYKYPESLNTENFSHFSP